MVGNFKRSNLKASTGKSNLLQRFIMILNKRIAALAKAGKRLREKGNEWHEILRKTEAHNRWFTEFHCELMLNSFSDYFLQEDKLEAWVALYPKLEEEKKDKKTAGLILAGNIPFVGMHDLLSVLITGNKAVVKLSSKDVYFFPWFMNLLASIEPEFSDSIVFTEKLSGYDAVIATGSNNTSRYFEYYFGKYPHLFRKNRTSVAVLSGDESEEELHELGKDVFYYYGLGCRNVGKIFIPVAFEVEKLFRIWDDFRYVSDNTKYKNNYDYNRALLLLNQSPHLANDFFMMMETEQLFSPLATVFYERYSSADDCNEKILAVHDDLQCVVKKSEGNTPFGKTQFPELWDYADHVDTVEFLLGF